MPQAFPVGGVVIRLGLMIAPLCMVLCCGFDACAEPTSDDEPTAESCDAAVSTARALIDTRPPGTISRYFAERYVGQAVAEGGNREFDDCVEWAEKAAEEIRHPSHALKPGETLNVEHTPPIVGEGASTSQVNSQH